MPMDKDLSPGNCSNPSNHETMSCCEYHCNNCHCTVCPSKPTMKALSGIQAQLKGAANALTAADQNVIFDTVVNHPNAVINYNPLTGDFTLPPNKNYYISWWVAIDGTELTQGAAFAIASDKEPVSVGSSPLVTCQLSGSALITTGKLPGTISLINASGNTIRYAGTSVQANIIIVN